MECSMNRHTTVTRNIRQARQKWGPLSRASADALEEICRTHHLSIVLGDLIQIDGSWYVTHAGMLRLARRNRCVGMHVHSVPSFCDLTSGRWAFKATVFKSPS